MVMSPFALLITLPFLVYGGKQCPDGHEDGYEYTEVNYKYKCVDGVRKPSGCVIEGTSCPVGGTVDSGKIRWQCVLGTDGYLSIMPKSCVSSGREYSVGDNWLDGSVWYGCKKEGSAIQADQIGCNNGGKPVAMGDSVASGNDALKCTKTSSGAMEMTKAGCAKDGKTYKHGGTYEDKSRQVQFTCTDSDWKATGCLNPKGGPPMNDQDKYMDNSVKTVYGCELNGENTKLVAAACIGRDDGVDQEKKPDCFWEEGDGQYWYKYTCKVANNKAQLIQMQCIYKHPDGVFSVNPGCYYEYATAKIAVGCVKVSEDTLKIDVAPIDRPSAGLSKC